MFQPGPDSIGAFALTRLNGGVAAQACCLIDLEAFKVEFVRMVDIHINIKLLDLIIKQSFPCRLPR